MVSMRFSGLTAVKGHREIGYAAGNTFSQAAELFLELILWPKVPFLAGYDRFW